MRQEFERLPRETPKAFDAFTVYLNLGIDRSTAKVAARVGKSQRLIRRWCLKYGWQNRAKAFMDHLAASERAIIESLSQERGVEWFRVHEAQKIAEWKLRTEYLELAQEAMRRWKSNSNRVGSLEGIARIGEVFVKLGRLSAGMPTEIKEVNQTGKATLDVNWTAAFAKVFPEAKNLIEVEEVGPKPALLEEKTP